MLLMLEVGTEDLDIQNCNGLTALMVAARIRTLRTAQALVNADADVSHRDLNGWAALHLAADAGPAESKFL
eukprot:m.396657 g.396657  ORF g.396657 m.396657 type:complete len:71 (+) comp56413_c1_seq4:1396-1608(+)